MVATLMLEIPEYSAIHSPISQAFSVVSGSPGIPVCWAAIAPCGDGNAELVIMRVRSACDNVRLPGVKSGPQRSLTTADHRSR